jgi:protein SCO1/2
MVTRLLAHRLLGPALAVAALVWGSAVVAFLRFGPGLAPWTDAVLAACFGWNAETRHYRLDALILALLQPPLFVGVVGVFYAAEVRAWLRSPPGRALGLLAASLFLALAGDLLASGKVGAGGPPAIGTVPPAPLRQGTPAPPFALVDHRGAAVTGATLGAGPVVLTFVYAGCHATCPVLIGRLKALEAAAPADARFAAVTLDPERDTPAALAEHATRWGLGDRWRLLTGEPRAVRAVLAAFGVRWTRLPDGEIAHENVVVLLDRAGRVAFTYAGLAHPEARLAADLARLAAERS